MFLDTAVKRRYGCFGKTPVFARIICAKVIGDELVSTIFHELFKGVDVHKHDWNPPAKTVDGRNILYRISHWCLVTVGFSAASARVIIEASRDMDIPCMFWSATPMARC